MREVGRLCSYRTYYWLYYVYISQSEQSKSCFALAQVLVYLYVNQFRLWVMTCVIMQETCRQSWISNQQWYGRVTVHHNCCGLIVWYLASWTDPKLVGQTHFPRTDIEPIWLGRQTLKIHQAHSRAAHAYAQDLQNCIA
jgi:hypothetical protein